MGSVDLIVHAPNRTKHAHLFIEDGSLLLLLALVVIEPKMSIVRIAVPKAHEKSRPDGPCTKQR